MAPLPESALNYPKYPCLNWASPVSAILWTEAERFGLRFRRTLTPQTLSFGSFGLGFRFGSSTQGSFLARQTPSEHLPRQIFGFRFRVEAFVLGFLGCGYR